MSRMTKPDPALTESHVEASMRLYGDAPTRERFPTVTEEAWLAKKLGLRHRLFEGVTTPEIRRERVRAAIVEIGGEVRAGSRNGVPETWARLFERLYGVAL